MKIHKQPSILLRQAAALASAVLFCGTAAQAGTIVYEGFDIPPGEVDNTKGATSWGFKQLDLGVILIDYTWNGWAQPRVGINDYFHAVSDGGLDYEGLASIGNAFEFTQETTDDGMYTSAYRETAKFWSYASTGQTWFSVLVNPRITGDPLGGGWFQVCLSNLQNDVYVGLANVNDQTVWSAGGERLKLDGVQGQKWAYSEVPVEDGVPAFLVMHLDFDTKAAYFYVNPPVDAEDPGEAVAYFTMWSDIYIDKIRMWIANAGPSVEGTGADYIGTRVDEIRVGTTYQSVAAGADLTDPGSGPVDTTPPVITGPSGGAGAATAEASVAENTVRVHTFTASETVIWSLSGGADKAYFTINAGTGGLSFKDPDPNDALLFPDFETPVDADANNVYLVQVQAMDEAGNTAVQEVSVTVTDVADEAPPVITGLSGQPGDAETTASIGEETFVVGTYTADEAATWDISGGADRTLFAINAGTGELAFLSAPDFETPADANADNVYEVEVRATDASLNASRQLVWVTVNDVDENAMWAFWAPGETGWIDTNSSGGLFMGWINVSQAPWVWSAHLNRYVYLPEEYISPGGGYAYAPLFMDNPTAGAWGYWAIGDLNWVDTTPGFLGWINVSGDPYQYCLAFTNYIILPQAWLAPSGSWFYILLRPPASAAPAGEPGNPG